MRKASKVEEGAMMADLMADTLPDRFYTTGPAQESAVPMMGIVDRETGKRVDVPTAVWSEVRRALSRAERREFTVSVSDDDVHRAVNAFYADA